MSNRAALVRVGEGEEVAGRLFLLSTAADKIQTQMEEATKIRGAGPLLTLNIHYATSVLLDSVCRWTLHILKGV